jgi:hypothetical protein
MRDLREINQYRDHAGERSQYGARGGDVSHEQWAGVFRIPAKGTRHGLLVIANSGDMPEAVGSAYAWDHVSVSLPMRCPTWEEMETVKRLFFLPDETAMQLHVDTGEHISNHRFCLHIWRPCDGREIPLPPSIMVGAQEIGTLPIRRRRAG